MKFGDDLRNKLIHWPKVKILTNIFGPQTFQFKVTIRIVTKFRIPIMYTNICSNLLVLSTNFVHSPSRRGDYS